MNFHLRIFLNTKYKIITIIIIFLASIFEFFGLSLIYPLIAILFDVSIANNNFLSFFKNQFLSFGLPITKLSFGAVILIMIFLKSILLLFYRYITSKSVLSFQQNLRIQIYKGLSLSNYVFFADKKSRFINSLTTQSQQGVSAMQCQYNMLEKLFGFLALLILCIILSYKILIVSIFVGLVILLIFNRTFKLARKWSSIHTKANEEYFQNITKGLNNIKYLKSVSLYENFFKEIIPNFKKIFKTQLFFSMLNKGTTIINEPIVLTAIGIIFFIGIYFLKLDPIIIIVMYVILGRLFQKVLGLINDFQGYSNDMPPLKYCFDLIDEIDLNLEKYGTIKYDKLKNNIEFKNVVFKYHDKLILDDVSFSLIKNNFNLIFGKSGSGKTTILNLILGLIKQQSGTITLNKNNLREYDLNTFRLKIGLVTQENTIFNLSIRDNMRLRNPKVYDRDIINYIKVFNLISIFNSNKIDLDYVVDESSSNLSLGEKQRLAIMRELLMDPEILILDEVTSSLDKKTVNIILEVIKKLSKSITIIAVSHQHEYLKIADNILKLENNKIIEENNI